MSFGNLGTESPFGAYKRGLASIPFLVLAVSGEHWNPVHQNRERKEEYAGLGIRWPGVWGSKKERERRAVNLQECSGLEGEASA